MKLSTGANSSYGAVQVYNEDEWQLVCDDVFTDEHALMVCKSLGFVDGVAVPYSGFGYMRSKIGLVGINCTGDETQLSDCGFTFGNVSNCDSEQYASVYCSEKKLSTIG